MENIIIHEILHILILSPNLYSNFLENKDNVYRQEEIVSNTGTQIVNKFITPKLVQLAKTHFNCSEIDGVYLENEDGNQPAGSHFEKIFFGNEIMTGQTTGNPVWSKFTLTLMEDSGWYKVDYTQAQELDWGKGKGCDFYQYFCNQNFSEFCGTNN